MKITINKFGGLVINDQQKYCPWHPIDLPDKDNIRCGDWCAIFSIVAVQNRAVATIFLCKTNYCVPLEDFTDERKSQ